MLMKADLLKQFDEILAKGQQTVDSAKPPAPSPAVTATGKLAPPGPVVSHDNVWVDPALGAEFRTLGMNLLWRMFTENSQPYKDFNELTGSRTRGAFRQALATIQSVRKLVEDGWLDKTKSLIAGRVFVDYLDLAETLLQADHLKDPAAVIIGSTLEAHMRALGAARSISLIGPNGKPKKADTLNGDLTKANAYQLNDNKQVIVWLDIRNDAAHGNYHKYHDTKVAAMLAGVRDFIARVPA